MWALAAIAGGVGNDERVREALARAQQSDASAFVREEAAHHRMIASFLTITWSGVTRRMK